LYQGVIGVLLQTTLTSVSKRIYGRGFHGFQQGQGGSWVGILFVLGPSIEQLIVLHLQTQQVVSVSLTYFCIESKWKYLVLDLKLQSIAFEPWIGAKNYSLVKR
jgi:hypothetical protein